MNEFLETLANSIAAPRYKGQLPEIRKSFNLYLKNMDTDNPDRKLNGMLLLCIVVVGVIGIVLI